MICAYNAAETLDECLRHTCALDYPWLEMIVVDDGSTDATAEIASRHPRARLLQIPHGGLAVARNEGFRAARGDLVAYLDADAYPTPEWPYYLALALDGPNVGGSGGPNLPPPDDPHGRPRRRAVPGRTRSTCSRPTTAPSTSPAATWRSGRSSSRRSGASTPSTRPPATTSTSAGRALDRGWKIGFHPAALVWHHRRPGLRTYLRQQRSYGRSEALVEARHPERFTAAGTARWRGRIYNSLTPSVAPQRIYRGIYGTAPYQSVYRGGGHLLDLVHQVGVPIAAVLLLTAPLALLSPWLALPALVALVGLLALGAIDMSRADPPAAPAGEGSGSAPLVAVHHLLQPLVRYWARNRHRPLARRSIDMRTKTCRLR